MCVRRVWDAAEGGDQGPVLERFWCHGERLERKSDVYLHLPDGVCQVWLRRHRNNHV